DAAEHCRDNQRHPDHDRVHTVTVTHTRSDPGEFAALSRPAWPACPEVFESLLETRRMLGFRRARSRRVTHVHDHARFADLPHPGVSLIPVAVDIRVRP